MPKSESGNVIEPDHLDLTVDELRLGRDRHRLRHAVERQVADQGDVGRGTGDRGRRDLDRRPVSVKVAVGYWSVWRPSLRIRLSRRDSSEAIVVVSTVSVPLVRVVVVPSVVSSIEPVTWSVRPTASLAAGRLASCSRDAVAGQAARPRPSRCR